MPYVDAPENVVPGNPQYYVTAVPVGGMAQGVVVESHMGRPIKIEGNPLHPASLGATSVHAQASILDLYDPDRSKNVTEGGEPHSWEDFLANFRPLVEQLSERQGAGLHIHVFYFLMTGLQAVHMLIGLTVVGVTCLRVLWGSVAEAYHTPVDIAGLYWDFIDVV